MRSKFSSILATCLSLQLSLACTTSGGSPVDETLVDPNFSEETSGSGASEESSESSESGSPSDASSEIGVESDSNSESAANNDATLPSPDSLGKIEESADFAKELSDDSAGGATASTTTPDDAVNGLPDGAVSGLDVQVGSENSSPVDVSAEKSIAQDLMRIIFARNSSRLSSDAKQSLAQIAERLKSEPSLTIKLQGFTDSSGSLAHNKRLAKRRAKEVKAALVSMGVEKSRVSIGEERALNRRVEVIFK